MERAETEVLLLLFVVQRAGSGSRDANGSVPAKWVDDRHHHHLDFGDAAAAGERGVFGANRF